MSQSLLIVHVQVHVKPDAVAAFRAATLANAQASVKSRGSSASISCNRVRIPTRFVLVEVYKNPDAPAAHKETAHYLAWRDAVDVLMAEPRTSTKYQNIFPDDGGW